MRVLFVSNLYPPNVVGGYERLCFEVASAFAVRGHGVHVLTSGHGGGTAEYPGQTIRRTLRLLAGEAIYDPFPGDAAARGAVNRANLEALRDALAEARPDAVFAWNLFFLDRSFLAALGGCGLPVYVMLTDNWLLSMERPEYLARFFQEHVFGRAPFPPVAEPPAQQRRRLRAFGAGCARSCAPRPPFPKPRHARRRSVLLLCASPSARCSAPPSCATSTPTPACSSSGAASCTTACARSRARTPRSATAPASSKTASCACSSLAVSWT
jgi:hypothetical protein